MADGMTLEMTGGEEIASKAHDLRIDLEKRLKNEVNIMSVMLQRHIREEYFRPYSGKVEDNSLQRRSGMLSKSIRPIPAYAEGDLIKGGVSVGSRYAAVHFGKIGQVTSISGSPWLTIPLPAALNNQGLAKGRARDEAVFGKTFFARSKNGNLILFGKLLYTKGKKVGEAKSDVVPLFVLKHQVEVKTRVHPEDLWRWVQPVLGKSLAALKETIESAHATYMEMTSGDSD
jgi:hypothetical protein